MEPDRRIRRIAVVGGGAAGWTAAALLNRKLGGQCSIHVVDTTEAMSPGHAEASLPTILELLRFLGIDQNDFVEKTQATYSLASRYADWATPGESFWRGYGALGALIERRPFYHFWHKARAQGLQPRLELFSQELAFAQAGRFIFPTNTLGVAPHLRFALHVDGALYARYLRSVAERGGVVRLERKLVEATRRDDGGIEELKFADGGSLRADLYLDCTGNDAQLIGAALGVGWQDWSAWLPCDRLLSVPAALGEVRPPYVQIDAHGAGWRRRLPLQTVMSHAYAYASAAQDEESARRELLAVAGEPQAEPRLQTLMAGRRDVHWRHNVIAVGTAGVGLDPLAGADLHLLANVVFNLLDHFPASSLDEPNIASFNAVMAEELDRIRDFIGLHYALARREDTGFWRQRAAAVLPESLAQRIRMYRATGRIVHRQAELFTDLDWFWIFEGLGVAPADYDPLVDTVDFGQVKRLMMAISQKITADTAAAPPHDSFFAQANARLAGARRAAAQATG